MSQALLPRPVADPDYLRRLREDALARMQQDEAEHTPSLVSRRWSLQRFGLIAASLTPAVTLLKPAFAAAPTGSLRCPAPQYGAPGMPGNPPVRTATAFATRGDLGSLDTWHRSSVQVIAEGTSGWTGAASAPARIASYQLPSGEPITLIVIAEPPTGKDQKSTLSFIVSGDAVFYISFGGDLWGAKFGYAELILSRSLFKTPTAPDGEAGAIERFAAMIDDKALAKSAPPRHDIHIALTQGVDPAYWGPETPQPRYPFIYSLSMTGQLLHIECSGPAQHYGGFSIDLKTHKLVKFTAR